MPKICPAKGHSPVHSSYPGGEGGGEPTFPTFPYKNSELFTWETKIRVTRLAGSLFFDSLVTLLAGPTILHATVWLSQPDQLGSKADTPEGFCSRSTLQALFARVSTHEGAFSSSFNLPREHFANEIYPWNRWYTRNLCSRSVPLEHAPGEKSLVCIGLNARALLARTKTRGQLLPHAS